MSEQIATPECDKLLAVSEKSQAIGEFLDWLASGEADSDELGPLPIELAFRPVVSFGRGLEKSEHLQPYCASTEWLLAKYFNIDLVAVERERRQLLKALRHANHTES